MTGKKEVFYLAKKKDEVTIRSSAAEYLTYVASVGDQQDSVEMVEDRDSISKNKKRECTNEAQALVVWAFSNFARNLRTIIFKKSIINL